MSPQSIMLKTILCANNIHHFTYSGIPEFESDIFTYVEDVGATGKEQEFLEALTISAKSSIFPKENVVYILALCIKSEQSNLRTCALKFLADILLLFDSKTLFNFLEALKKVAALKSTTFSVKQGLWGKAIRSALKKWYDSKDATALANMFTCEPGGHGWTHKDILKQIHYKSPNEDTDAVIKYFVFQKSEAKSSLPEDCAALATSIECLKTCSSDASLAASTMTNLKLPLTSVPPQFNKSPKFWSEYILSLPILDVLHNLDRWASKMKLPELLLACSSAFAEINGSEVDPADVLAALKRYETLYYEKRKETAVNKHKAEGNGVPSETAPKSKPTVVSPIIVASLSGLLKRSFDALAPTNNKWLVVVHLRSAGTEACSRLSAVTTGCASALIALYSAAVATSSVVSSNKLLSVAGNEEIKTFTEKLSKVKKHEKTPALALTEVLKRLSCGDLTVLLTEDEPTSKCIQDILQVMSEKRAAHDKKLRLAIVFLKGYKARETVDDADTLIVTGFKPPLTRVLAAFANDEF